MPITPTEKMLLELITVPSVTGQERKLAERLLAKLAGAFRVRKIPVARGRFDVLATVGRPKTLFVAHIDTVPGALPTSVSREFIHGRGACDNKGSAAAMISASLAARAAGLVDFGLLFTVGEEVDLSGAAAAKRHLAKAGIRPRLVVIGEPTGLRPVTAQKGVLNLRLTCSGRRAHSSLTARDSATEKLARLLVALVDARLPKTLVNIGSVHGGEAPNVVAERAEAVVSFRSSLPDVARRVRGVIERQGIACGIETLMEAPPVERRVAGFPRHEVAYFTELAYFRNGIVCGPGDVLDAHSGHEKVSRAELAAAVDFYGALLARQAGRVRGRRPSARQ